MMRRLGWRLATVLLAIGMMPVLGAEGQAKPTASVELRLVAGTLVDGVPSEFTFELVNVSQHDVRVPKPSIDCGNSYAGEIWLHFRFKPLVPVDGPGVGWGCAADTVTWPTIVERVEGWELLHPGERVSVTERQEKLHYDGSKAGSYEFWAEYRPAYLSADDKVALREVGIDVPEASLTTAHQRFTREP